MLKENNTKADIDKHLKEIEKTCKEIDKNLGNEDSLFFLEAIAITCAGMYSHYAAQVLDVSLTSTLATLFQDIEERALQAQTAYCCKL